jgi:predicted nucleic acid-binding protein
MMVVDASVWVSLFLEIDFFHLRSYAWFEEYSRRNGEMTVPTLLLTEVAAALIRRTNDPAVGKTVIDYLLNLRGLHIVPVDHRLALTAAELAAECRLRGADAVYMALAYTLGVPLLTWDHEQITRVQKVIRAGTLGTPF